MQDGDDYVIYGFQRFPVAKAYPSERGYPVVSWKLGDWVAETDSGQYVNLAPNVPGKVWNGKHIIGIHCFFFAPGGA